MTFIKNISRRNHRKRLRLFVTFVVALAVIIVMYIQLSDEDFVILNESLSQPYAEPSVSRLQAIRNNATECLIKFLQSMAFDQPSLLKKAMNGIWSSIHASKMPLTYSELSKFNILLSSLGVRNVIIEPSILYCMLTNYYQEILVKRNFNLTHISRSKNIVTLGILEHDVAALHQEENIEKFRKAGFVPEFVATPVVDWMKETGIATDAYVSHIFYIKSDIDSYISHIFYESKYFIIHVVVFYERGSYLWHAALNSTNNPHIPSNEELMFVDYNGAYEKFTFFSLGDPVGNFSIPSTSHYFLFETMSSRFLECSSFRVEDKGQPKSHPGMSLESFKKRTLIALHQLKHIFHPLLMNLWIWSGTMLGWYRQCDIIPYTTDVDFAAWATEVEDLYRILNLLLNSESVKIKEKMGLLEEALEFNVNSHGLRTDVFFLYQINNGSWCSGHSPLEGYYFRYYYPNFTLCSADLLGEKVQVPCETEKVIITEYGKGWKKPVSKWSYKTSIHNRGPNKYWDEKKRKDVYTVYS